MKPLITDEQRAQLLANGQVSAQGGTHDPLPVVTGDEVQHVHQLTAALP